LELGRLNFSYAFRAEEIDEKRVRSKLRNLTHPSTSCRRSGSRKNSRRIGGEPLHKAGWPKQKGTAHSIGAAPNFFPGKSGTGRSEPPDIPQQN